MPCRHLHGHVSTTCTVLWGNFGLAAAWLPAFCASLTCSWTAAERRTQALRSQDPAHTSCTATQVDFGWDFGSQQVPALWWVCDQGTDPPAPAAWGGCEQRQPWGTRAAQLQSVQAALTRAGAAGGGVRCPRSGRTARLVLFNGLHRGQSLRQAQAKGSRAPPAPRGGPRFWGRGTPSRGSKGAEGGTAHRHQHRGASPA